MQTESCNIQECPVDCLWSDWTKSGGCTKSCGGGFQYFERTMLVKAQNGGKSCTGGPLKRENCNDHNCLDTTTTTTTTTTVPKINCQWSSWSEAGPCSKSCGGGVQYFERTINVESQNGGQSCTGSRTKREYCNTQNCPCYCNIDNRCSCRRDSQKEERLNDAAWEGDLATVRELIKTTFVDTTEGSPTRIIDGSSLGWTP